MKYLMCFAPLFLAASCNCDCKKSELKIVSPIIEVKLDANSSMPSYCKPESYTIVKSAGYFFVRLPGGTVIDKFNSIEEAQADINKQAAQSLKNWTESGGVEF